jgi:hypothetical protein
MMLLKDIKPEKLKVVKKWLDLITLFKFHPMIALDVNSVLNPVLMMLLL